LKNNKLTALFPINRIDNRVTINMNMNDLDKHKKSKHPKEYQAEQEAYIAKHPFECKHARCKKRFETEVEVDRHHEKLH